MPLVECEVVENQLQGEAHLDVWTEDGEHLHADTAVVIGHPDNPMSEDELHAKFLDCAGRALEPAKARSALDLLLQRSRVRSHDDLRPRRRTQPQRQPKPKAPHGAAWKKTKPFLHVIQCLQLFDVKCDF